MSDLVHINSDNNLPIVDGLDGFSLRPTTVKLMQPTSTGQAGMWLDTLTGEEMATVTIIPLAFTANRAFYPPGLDFTGSPICKSSDGIRPNNGVEQKQADFCKNCARAEWKEVGGKKIKPDCANGYRMLCLIEDSLLPKFFYFMRTAAPVVQSFGEILKAKIISAKNRGEGNFTLHDFKVTLKTSKVPGKAYYKAVFSDVKLHGKDIRNEYEMYTSKSIPFTEDEVVDEGVNEALETTFEEV